MYTDVQVRKEPSKIEGFSVRKILILFWKWNKMISMCNKRLFLLSRDKISFTRKDIENIEGIYELIRNPFQFISIEVWSNSNSNLHSGHASIFLDDLFSALIFVTCFSIGQNDKDRCPVFDFSVDFLTFHLKNKLNRSDGSYWWLIKVRWVIMN